MATYSNIWVNTFDRFGNLTNSTPFNSLAEAVENAETMVSFLNRARPTRPFVRKDEHYEWTNESGRICINSKGSIITHLETQWLGITANYAVPFEDMHNERPFVQFLASNLGIYVDEEWQRFADNFFSDKEYHKRVLAEYNRYLNILDILKVSEKYG